MYLLSLYEEAPQRKFVTSYMVVSNKLKEEYFCNVACLAANQRKIKFAHISAVHGGKDGVT